MDNQTSKKGGIQMMIWEMTKMIIFLFSLVVLGFLVLGFYDLTKNQRQEKLREYSIIASVTAILFLFPAFFFIGQSLEVQEKLNTAVIEVNLIKEEYSNKLLELKRAKPLVCEPCKPVDCNFSDFNGVVLK